MKKESKCKYCGTTTEDHNVLDHYGAGDSIELKIRRDFKTDKEYEAFIKMIEEASRPVYCINGKEYPL